MEQERRQFQRLHLTKPLDGTFGRRKVRIVDVSAIGALVEGKKQIPIGSRGRLKFTWRGQTVQIMSETIRSDSDQAGLSFVEDSELLRTLIAESAAELLRAQEANMTGDRELNVVGEETLTAASMLKGKGFLMYVFDNGTWTRRKALLPDQPPNGFTVAAAEPQEQIDMLCRTYENGDAETQRMTRLLAELSVATVRE